MVLEHLESDPNFLKHCDGGTDNVIDAYICLRVQQVTRLRLTTRAVGSDRAKRLK